jgi:hypothetical protein
MLALALGACLFLAACGGSSRSVAAVCNVWDTEGLALHEKFESANKSARGEGAAGVLSALVSVIGAPNELARLMSQMAAVAPTSAEPDFEAVGTAFKKLSESEGKAFTDPLGALGGSLMESLAVSGSFTRVNGFLATNCGIPKEKG